ncbi:MAG TPA: prepilin-type N-terminal cleavage/methylation domain-containing protein [Burkholderiaceae bacterium]
MACPERRTRPPLPWHDPTFRPAGGFTLIEVLVTIVVLVFGILGVIGMQTLASANEFESYQRGQALAMARDMQARLQSSRGVLAGYLNPGISSGDGSVYFGNGTGATNFADSSGNCPAPVAGDPLSEAKAQICAWGVDLQGAAAKEGANAVGAMAGARGCVIQVTPPQLNALADLYVVIVWQGITKRADPLPDSAAGQCASDVDFGAGLRRGVSVRVLVPDLHKSS